MRGKMRSSPLWFGGCLANSARRSWLYGGLGLGYGGKRSKTLIGSVYSSVWCGG
jgi:hypothetical protein